MKRLSLRKKIFILFLSLLSIFFSTIYITYENRIKIRNYIIDRISIESGFDLKFKKEIITFFPFPGIKLKELTLTKNSNYTFYIFIQNAEIDISIKDLLLRKLRIRKVVLNNGKFQITKNEKLVLEQQSSSLNSELNNLNIEYIEIKETSIEYYESPQKLKEEIKINSLVYEVDILGNPSLEFFTSYRQGSIKGKLDFEIDPSNLSIDTSYFKGDITLQNFSILSAKPFYSFFKKARFDSTTISGNVYFLKKKSSNDINIHTNIILNSVNFKEIPFSPPIELNSRLIYKFRQNKLVFDSVNARMGDYVAGFTTGELQFGKIIVLRLDIKADYVKLKSIISFIISFLDFDIQDNIGITFIGDLKIESKEASFEDYIFLNPRVGLEINDTIVNFKIHNFDFNHGKVNGDGKIIANEIVSYNFDLKADKIDAQSLISRYTDKKFITSELQTEINIHSYGNDLDQFINNLIIKGNVKATNGSLLGYANIYKPIMTIGKIINFSGPKGDSTSFQSITTKFIVKKRNVEISEFKMVGVGIDATGKGKIGFDRKINFRLHVGLGGIAGKALSIPIIYKGVMPDNAAYIDPLWISSVYLGTLLGGPHGTAVGGVAGSALSEYVRNSYEKIKGFFFLKSDDKENKE